MCDADGASVVAPEDIPEVDRGHFEALPCDTQLLLWGVRFETQELGHECVRSSGDSEPAPVPQAAPAHDRYDAARVLPAQFPARIEPLALVLGERDGLDSSLGYARGTFRPPARHR